MQAPPPASPPGRIATIDILRGLAILWVMTFHLWTDMTGGRFGVSPLYRDLADRIGEGAPLAALTAAGELLLASGYQGVIVFMTLSGASLMLHADSRPGLGVAELPRRIRRLAVPYWGGIVFVLVVIGALALLRMVQDGSSAGGAWRATTIGDGIPVRITWSSIAWSMTVFGWIWQPNWVASTVGSIWFVPLLMQYYLLFPVLLLAIRRIGPWPFLALSFIVTIAARAFVVEWGADLFGAEHVRRVLDIFALCRLSEFTLGIVAGYLFVHRHDATRAWMSSAFDIGGLILLALLAQWASVSISSDASLLEASFAPLGHASLAILIVILMFARRAAWQSSIPARALIALGVVSFTALIVNDAMRYVASYLRAQDLPGIVWATFIVAIYIPLGTLIAYPLAHLFGIPPPGSGRQAPENAARARAVTSDARWLEER